MRRKKFAAMLLCLSVFVLFGCSMRRDDDTVAYCYTMNRILADEEFSYAEVGQEGMRLYDADGGLLSELPFAQYDASIRVLSVRKKADMIFFVTQGSVDDENGYVFINGEANSIFEGIWYLERVSGNGYAYATARP